jgi:ribosome-associated toxin RatA of RatAB toxin-antitoxin module
MKLKLLYIVVLALFVSGESFSVESSNKAGNLSKQDMNAPQGLRLPKVDFSFSKSVKSQFEIVSINTSGTVEGVKATQLLAVQYENVVKSLTDYQQFTEFMPNVDKSKIINVEAGAKFVETELDFGLFDVSYILKMDENIDIKRNRATIEWTRESGDLNIISGRWELVKMGEATAVKYISFVDSGVAIPTWIQSLLTKGAVPDLFEAVAEHSAKIK